MTSPSLENFEAQLNEALRNHKAHPAGRWTRRPLEILSNLNYLVIACDFILIIAILFSVRS